jgi:hypothetical protein
VSLEKGHRKWQNQSSESPTCTYRMAHRVPTGIIDLAEPGSLACPPAVAKLSQNLFELMPTEGDIVVLDLLSSSPFVGTSEEGMPMPPHHLLHS